MVLTPLGRKPHWPADYISYTVELQSQYDDGLISKAEVELRLQARYPQEPVPDERTRRRWAHEKYSDLPERRRQFLGPQGLDWVPNYAPVTASLQGIQRPVSWLVPPQVTPVQNGFSPVALDLINWMVACMMVAISAAMARMVISSL